LSLPTFTRTPCAIIHSQNTCDISTPESYYLNFIASELYMQMACSVMRVYIFAARISLLSLRGLQCVTDRRWTHNCSQTADRRVPIAYRLLAYMSIAY